MPNVSEVVPTIKINDTPAPDHVLEAVDQMRAAGKTVTQKMTQEDYNRLMTLPHEQRLQFAKKVMRAQELRARIKAADEQHRRDRKARKTRRKQAQRKNRK